MTRTSESRPIRRRRRESAVWGPLLSLTVLGFWSSGVIAAGPPPPPPPPPTPDYNISDAVKDANAPKELPKQPPPGAPVILQEKDAPQTEANGPKILVRDFRVEGAEFIEPEDLQRVLGPYRNRELTIGQINEVANRLTVLCRNRGYLVARAFVPKQEMHDGVLVIKLVAGKYGKFQIKDSSRVHSEFLQGMFEAARSNSPIVTRESLERTMLLVGDMPGARTPEVSISAGSEPGTSDFTVAVNSSDVLNGYVLADNFGSRFTGKDRLSAGLDLNSPFGIGDKIALSGMSTSAAGLQNARLAYDFPLTHDGLRGEFAAWRTTYKLGAEFENLNANGVADAVEGTLSYPLRRTRDDSIYVSMTLADKYLRDDTAVPVTTIAKRAKVAVLGLQNDSYGRLFGLNSFVSIGGSLTLGKLKFSDEMQAKLNQRGADTAGHYRKLNLSYNGLLSFTSKWSLATSLRAQESLNKNLDGSEQLSISGVGGIKSYPDGVTNDNGVLLGAELKYALPALGALNQTSGMFANYGEVSPAHGSYTTVRKVAISDAGFAYDASFKNAFGRAQVARTTGSQKETSPDNHEWKALVLLGARF